MRITLLLLFLIQGTFVLRSQDQLVDDGQLKWVWDRTMPGIIDNDIEKVLTQTHFPLEVFRGKKETLSLEAFREQYATFFSPFVISQIKNSSYRNLDAWSLEDDEVVMVLFCKQSPGSEKKYHYYFKRYDGKWKLYLIGELSE